MRIKESREWQSLADNPKAIISRYQDEIPVNLVNLARALGVPVKAATLAPGVSGEIRPDGQGSYIIRVNRHDASARQRFTVAHELAHFLLHRDLIGDGITDDVLYRSSQSDRIEAEANRLAADILMPADKIMQVLPEIQHSDDPKAELAARFRVSNEAMSIKLGGIF